MSRNAFRWTDAEVRRALGLSGGDPSKLYRRISTDTRSLRPGDVFVALRGDSFDGHDFVEAAVAAGCGAVVLSQPTELPVPVHRVDDTLKALGDLARRRRDHEAEMPVVGITGSSGKTTVKDLTLGALSSLPGVHGTEANNNNRIGVPLTILSMPDDMEGRRLSTPGRPAVPGAPTTPGRPPAALVLEMGTNEPGEIAELARIARPTLGVVSTVSETHVERLGSLAGVMSEKLELIRALPSEAAAVVGDEPAALAEEARALHPGCAVAGWSERADPGLRPSKARVGPDGVWRFEWRGQPVALRMPGAHNVHNALLALAVSRYLGVPEDKAAAGVSAVGPGAMRNEFRRVGDLALLVDCYNASAAGVSAAVSTLEAIQTGGRKVAVLGTMLELGERSRALHRETLERALDAEVDRFVLTGAFAHAARKVSDARVYVVERVEELAERLPALVAPGDAVLLKASRGVRLERAIPALESAFGESRGRGRAFDRSASAGVCSARVGAPSVREGVPSARLGVPV